MAEDKEPIKTSDFVEALERFFLDAIGTVLPGLTLLGGLCYATGESFAAVSSLFVDKTADQEWLILILMAYILGHGITSLGHAFTRRLDALSRSPLLREAFGVETTKDSTAPNRWFFSFVQPESESVKELLSDPTFLAFKKTALTRIPALQNEDHGKISVRTWRSIAMSIAPENSPLIYRFQFIALFNLGIATASVCTVMAWVLFLFLSSVVGHIKVIDVNFVFFLLIIAPYLFFERYYTFNRMALQVPFSVALVKLDLVLSDDSAKPLGLLMLPEEQPRLQNQQLGIYLAGGFKSGWQDKVMRGVPSLRYYDPRSHGLTRKEDYTAWDLKAIQRCDCVFAYLEESNPGGYALALEVGFAKALGKLVIFVNDDSSSNTSRVRYLEMLKAASDFNCNNLDDGIIRLQSIAALS